MLFENLLMLGVVILLFAVFGAASVYSILNTNTRNAACRSCRDGRRPNVTVGSVIAMPCANNTVIYNSGNATQAVLNFGIPSNCVGARGPNGSVILSVFDSPANLTYIKDMPFASTTNLAVSVIANETITYIQVPGDTGSQGGPGPKGNTGIQGIQGPQGPTIPQILGIGRIITPGVTSIPLPAGATAIYYIISGSGGGGGGGCGFYFNGCGGGGGGSGVKRTGFELLFGVSSVSVSIGAGGAGGNSYDVNQVPTSGAAGAYTIMSLVPVIDIYAVGGTPGSPCFFNMAGNGGDGGYGGGGGGSSIGTSPGFDGDSINDGLYNSATSGQILGGNGGNGAGPNYGLGGLGTATAYGNMILDIQGRLIAMSGGGGGGGGPRFNSGGRGGSFINSLSGSGQPGAPGSGGGGGGAAGNGAGGDIRGQQNADLIVLGDTGGSGGSGYLDYFFV